MQRYSVSTFTTRVQASEKKPVSAGRERDASPLSAADEAVLTSITTSGEFTLDKVRDMYAGVTRLRNKK